MINKLSSKIKQKISLRMAVTLKSKLVKHKS